MKKAAWRRAAGEGWVMPKVLMKMDARASRMRMLGQAYACCGLEGASETGAGHLKTSGLAC